MSQLHRLFLVPKPFLKNRERNKGRYVNPAISSHFEEQIDATSGMGGVGGKGGRGGGHFTDAPNREYAAESVQ